MRVKSGKADTDRDNEFSTVLTNYVQEQFDNNGKFSGHVACLITDKFDPYIFSLKERNLKEAVAELELFFAELQISSYELYAPQVDLFPESRKKGSDIVTSTALDTAILRASTMEAVRHLQLGDTSTRPGLVLRTVNQDILNEIPIYKEDSRFDELKIYG